MDEMAEKLKFIVSNNKNYKVKFKKAQFIA